MAHDRSSFASPGSFSAKNLSGLFSLDGQGSRISDKEPEILSYQAGTENGVSMSILGELD